MAFWGLEKGHFILEKEQGSGIEKVIYRKALRYGPACDAMYADH